MVRVFLPWHPPTVIGQLTLILFVDPFLKSQVTLPEPFGDVNVVSLEPDAPQILVI